MRDAWVNLALLVVVLAELATGFVGLTNGAIGLRWLLWLHGIGGYAILVLLRWKGAIIRHAWVRHKPLDLPRGAAAALVVLLLTTLATGLIWTFSGRLLVAGSSVLTIHTALGIAMLPLLVWHAVWQRAVLQARALRARRAFLRLAGSGLAGLALWQGAGALSGVLAWPGSRRRFTGSYEVESPSGAFPTVSWLFDDPPPVDPATWRLVVDGAVDRPLSLGYAELLELDPTVLTATLDCTGGWFSTQVWEGVSVGYLLALARVRPGARSVTVTAVSGYSRRFALDVAASFILATKVAGIALPHGHGFPVRLVAPDHRGFEWVKWVSQLRVSESSELWQPPVPLR